MVDTTALVALVVAGVALVVAAGQLTQQLLATAYVIRKCDRVVTGGLTKGATRQWHWRQCRFSVKYQVIICALPQSVYNALGIMPSVQVDNDKPSHELWDSAIKLRANRSPMQGCWVTFVQDLIACGCIPPRSMYLKNESGDRIPDDLTVAPTQFDAITVLLACIAMGMQVYRFSPDSGEIALGGRLGSITFSSHPVLGTLLHYSVFSNEPTAGLGIAQRHGQALCHREGIWANAVFGRFRDMSYRLDFVPLIDLIRRKMDVLQANGWNQMGSADSTSPCFLSFAHVDCYLTLPPSVAHQYCAHFAEIIVKAHHIEMSHIWTTSKPLNTLAPSVSCLDKIKSFVESHGYSSPHEKSGIGLAFSAREEAEILSHLESNFVTTCEHLLPAIKSDGTLTEISDRRDPSSYTSAAAAWEVIILADYCMSDIAQRKYGSSLVHPLVPLAEKIIAIATSSLWDCGPPSWGNAAEEVARWPQIFSDSCEALLTTLDLPPPDREWALLYTRSSILRAAYYTIMMRAAGEVGTGITDETAIQTALVYMA